TASPPPHIYTLSLHDALPIYTSCLFCSGFRTICKPDVGKTTRSKFGTQAQEDAFRYEPSQRQAGARRHERADAALTCRPDHRGEDRKSTRLNSSHVKISYAVF